MAHFIALWALLWWSGTAISLSYASIPQTSFCFSLGRKGRLHFPAFLATREMVTWLEFWPMACGKKKKMPLSGLTQKVFLPSFAFFLSPFTWLLKDPVDDFKAAGNGWGTRLKKKTKLFFFFPLWSRSPRLPLPFCLGLWRTWKINFYGMTPKWSWNYFV